MPVGFRVLNSFNSIKHLKILGCPPFGVQETDPSFDYSILKELRLLELDLLLLAVFGQRRRLGLPYLPNSTLSTRQLS